MSDLVSEVREALGLPAPGVAKAIRVSAGVSQERLAEEIGCHRVTLARYEGGQRAPRGELRVRYARTLRQLEAVIAS